MSRDGWLPPGVTDRDIDMAAGGYWDEPEIEEEQEMTDQQVATRKAAPANPVVQFDDYLQSRIGEYRKNLPSHIPVERFVRVIRTQALMNPEILACDRRSLGVAIMRAAADGLLPDGVEGVISTYGNKAQWVPMYQGMLKKVRQSGELKAISVGIVYEGDTYDHWVDETGEHFMHRSSGEADEKNIRRAYCIAVTKDGGSFIADLSKRELDKHRSMSRTKREDSPWQKWYEAMAKKTAIRVLYKLLPKSTDLDDLMQREDRGELGVESLEERREARSNVTAMDQFTASEPEGEGPGESAAVESASVEDGAARSLTPANAEQYFSQAEATIEEMRQHGSTVEELTRWFTSKDQRALRSKLAIAIEDVTAFHKRMFE